MTDSELEHFALQLINGERQKLGYTPLSLDEVSQKVAQTQAADLARRRVISHLDSNGDNPDRRYTLSGGTDALFECLVALQKSGDMPKHNCATVARSLKVIMGRQDEREALISPDATGCGLAFAWSKEKDKAIACLEVVTKHGIIHPIAPNVHMADKIEVKGVVMQPYRFEKLTLAWEAKNSNIKWRFP